ncbi:hypothetical protein HPC37_02440 [Pasteurellaceae bacterium 20609_3]|uniref:hypothetical protein n=1 Tax=Spirabiliibacterium mucosae TaxID=28156 RepID=UPI001AAD6F99|nr:hypothetical protein [Spirabiliibacterium mucosae]MBE2897722.1 hypothetical protein [Spirabiliibacterium mucosae]
MQKTLIASAICALAVAAGAHAAAGPNGTNDITAGTKENPESPQSYCANHNCNFSVAWKGDDLILQSDYVSSAGAKRIVFKDYAKKLPVEAQQLKAKIREIRNKPDVTEEDIDSIKVKLKWTGRVYQGDEKDHDEGTFEFDFAPAGVNTENKTITVPATDSGSKAVFDIKQDNGKNAFVFNEKKVKGLKHRSKTALKTSQRLQNLLTPHQHLLSQSQRMIIK